MFPLWILGCLISLGGSVGAIVGTTVQKLSFRKNDALPLASRRIYWRQRWWLAGLFLVFLGGVTDFAALSMTPQSTIAALGSPPLAANVFLAHYWLGEAVTGRDFAGTFLIVLGSTLSVVFGDHDGKSYTSEELQQLYGQPAYIIYGAILLGAIVVMYSLCRWKLSPLRIKLIEAIDAHAVVLLEESVDRAEEAAQEARAQLFRFQLQQEYEESAGVANGQLLHAHLGAEGAAQEQSLLFSPPPPESCESSPGAAAADGGVSTKLVEVAPSASDDAPNSASDADAIAAASARLSQRHPRPSSSVAARSPLLLGGASSDWNASPQNLDAPLLGDVDPDLRADAEAEGLQRSMSPAASEVRVILASADGEGEGEHSGEGRRGGGALSSSSSYSAYEAADEAGRAARCASMPPGSEVLRLRARVDALERRYKPWAKLHPVFFCALSGIFGAQSLLFGKSVASLLATSVSAAGPNQFAHPLTYAFMAALGVCLLGQLHFFATGLHFFQALLVVPVFKCFFLTLSTLGGALYFKEVDTFTPLQWALFPLGLVLNLCGVYVLSSRDMRVEGSTKAKPPAIGERRGATMTAEEAEAAEAEAEEVRSVLAREESARFGAGAAAAAFEELGAACSPGYPHPHHLPRAHSHHYAQLHGDDARSQASYAYSHAPSRALSGGASLSAAQQAQAISDASESLLRSAVAIANDELLHPHSHRTFSSSSAMAFASPAAHAWEQHHVQGVPVLPAVRTHSHPAAATHHTGLVDPGHAHGHEGVLLVSTPMEGVLLVASELPGGGGGGGGHPGSVSAFPSRLDARSPALHPLSSSRVPTRVVSPALSRAASILPSSESWVSPEPLAVHMHNQQQAALAAHAAAWEANNNMLQRSSSRQSLMGGTSGGGGGGGSSDPAASSLYPGLTASPSAASFASPSFYTSPAVSSMLPDGSSAMSVAVFAAPAPSSSASASGLAQVSLSRTTSEQPPRHPSAAAAPGPGMGARSRVQSASNLASLGSSSFGLLPPRASAPGTPRSSVPGTPRRRAQAQAHAHAHAHAPDILVQRGGLIYRAPAHSEETPLDSSMGLGLPGAGPGSDSGSSASALDSLPLFLTPADSSSFTVTSPTTAEQYSMAREGSVFPHTRGFMARLANAAGIMRALSPGTPGSLQYAGYPERARSSAVSPSPSDQRVYTAPTPRAAADGHSTPAGVGAVSAMGSASFAAHRAAHGHGYGGLSSGGPSHSHASPGPSASSLALMEEEAAWREARDRLAFAHIIASPPSDAQSGTNAAHSALLPPLNLAPPHSAMAADGAPLNVPPPFLFQPLAQPQPQPSAADEPHAQ